MPRKARINSAGVLQHVMARAIEGRDLFCDDEDRDEFLRLFSKRLNESGYKCYAWVLMSNHYHFFLRTNENPLSELMKPLNSDFARYLNKKNNRRGYVFQDRYKSIATQDQFYVEQIVRYIHLNPFRAGICRSLQQLNRFLWSGHSALIGTVHRDFQDTDTVLRRFGNKLGLARKSYIDFICEGLKETTEDDTISNIRRSNDNIQNRHNTGCWVIGDQPFVQKVLQRDAENRVRIARYKREGWDCKRLAAFVAKETGVSQEDLGFASKRTAIADARMIFCFLGSKELGIPTRDIGNYLGISQAAVSASSRKGVSIVKNRKIALSNS